MSNPTTLALLDNLRTKVPGAEDATIKLEIYNTVDELCREALRTTAPTDVDDDPADWLAAELWVPNYQCILEGSLARLYAQPGKPWTNPEYAKAHQDRYAAYLQLARTLGVDDVATVYERLIKAIHTQIPMVREGAIKLALFGVCNRIRIEALRLVPLTSTDTTTSTWLPTDKWDEAYLAAYHGTLSRLHMQGGQPWADTALATANDVLFQQELQELRGAEISPSIVIAQRLLDRARVVLPGARDNVMEMELLDVAEEACRVGHIWRMDLELDLVADQIVYDIALPTGAKFVALRSVTHDNTAITLANLYYDIGDATLTFDEYIPTADDVALGPMVLNFALTPETEIGDISSTVLERYYQLFLDGLLARMFAHNAKSYSNAGRAIQHRRIFNVAVAVAKRDAQTQGVVGGQYWRFPRGMR
jgi:hypothetical protein